VGGYRRFEKNALSVFRVEECRVRNRLDYIRKQHEGWSCDPRRGGKEGRNVVLVNGKKWTKMDNALIRGILVYRHRWKQNGRRLDISRDPMLFSERQQSCVTNVPKEPFPGTPCIHPQRYTVSQLTTLQS
jgi:hypothetical protein